MGVIGQTRIVQTIEFRSRILTGVLQKVSERYDSGDRRLANDGIIWETDYWKLLKQYNQLTIALVKQLKEDT